MTSQSTILEYDLKNVVSPNRLVGLWRLLTGYHMMYIAAAFSIGLSSIARTGTFFLLRYFINNYFVTPDPAISLPLIAAGFIGLALIEGSFTFLSGRLTAESAEGTIRRLRNYLFDHIQHLSFTYHSHMETGELIERCTSDVDALRRFYSEQLIGISRITLLFIINFIAIMQLNTTLGLLSIIIVPIIVLVSVFFFKKISVVYESYQEQEAILSTTLQENLTGIRVVKAFARQAHEIEKFDGDNLEKYKRGKKLLLMHSTFWPISDTLCGLQMVAGYLAAAVMAIEGKITVGDYLAYAGLIVMIVFPMRNLGRLIVNMSTGMVSFGRVLKIIREPREPLDKGDYLPSNPIRGEIEFKDICFEYEENASVLKDIRFTARPGEVIALLGSTGSGKTTLVNLIPRFFEYTSGQILLDDIELKRYPRRYLRQQIGIVEQEPFLFSRSIRENITYGVSRPVSQSEVEEAARAASIHDVILSFPKGYETMIGEKGVTLSGGQKQRVAIARALLKDPRILILDDSTSSVDTETEGEIRSALNNLMRNRTTFVIAHRVQSIMNANQILVMDDGKIIQHGIHGDLIRQEGMYKQIFEIQTRIEAELEKEISNV